MAPEIDDDEIEQHLIEKINQAITNLRPQQNIVTKSYPIKDDFEKVLEILKGTTNPVYQADWSSVRRESLYQVNNLLTDWQMTKSQSLFSTKEVHNSRENIKKTLGKMIKKLQGEDTSSSRGQRDTTTNDDERPDSYHQEPKHTLFKTNKEEVYRWSSRHKPRNIYGFEHRIMAMERDLVIRNIDAPYKVFGVVGVAGIGKTTFCQDIFSRSSVTKHFCPRLWVCLSRQPRDRKDYKEEVVVRMLKCLGIEDEIINAAGNDGQYGLKRLLLLLRLQLIGKRYLIVFDDAWYDPKPVTKKDDKNKDETKGEEDDLIEEDTFFLNLTQKEELDENWGHELAYGLPKGSGGTIISSSRSQALLKKMLGKDVSLQHLKVQTEENIEKIFNDAVIGYDEDKREMPPYLENFKREILRKCDGIPLAAKLLAKIAREKLQPTQQKTTTTSAAGGQVPAGGLAGGGGLPKSKPKNDPQVIGSNQGA